MAKPVINYESPQQSSQCPNCAGTGVILVGYWYGPVYNYCPLCGGRGQIVNPSFQGSNQNQDKFICKIKPYFYNWDWFQSSTEYRLYQKRNGDLYLLPPSSWGNTPIQVMKSGNKEWDYTFYCSGWYYFNL